MQTPTSAGDDVPETPASAVESGCVHTNGVETYYERRGEGPVVVFVHGAIMDTRMWAPQVAELADAYTVVTYDVRGHGRTGGSAAATYSAGLYAADLDALLDELDVDRAVLCGLSMGGMIAQMYAARHPERVAGLVLADTFTPAPLGWAGRFLFLNDRLVALVSPYISYKRLNYLKLRVGNLLAPGVAGDVETVQRLVEEGPTMAPAELRKVVDSLAAFARGEFDPAAIRAPMLVLYGEHEPALLADMADYLCAAIPDAEMLVVPGAGHASNLDNPGFFTDAVREFLAEVDERERTDAVD
ncbi:alpha/beta fold hydrolase [Halorarius halobius]|uniref:alpha/beta fold hydrolase n=1 Tax=Halorarius halobius TaxID=2962671 RepID=UPI0020CFD92F|nr:alpha/beta hydrolase [Halorarius halobius]